MSGPLIQRSLPPSDFETWLDKPFTPLLNVLRGRDRQPQPADLFPLEGILMAPNSARFLASLGKPLVIAREFESRPGVWWLVDQANRVEWAVFSDSHRKNSWKGGTVNVAFEEGARPTHNHPGVVAFQRAMVQVWGAPRSPVHMLGWSEWFDERVRQSGQPAWPVAPRQGLKKSPRP